jgi:hypothetical protein
MVIERAPDFSQPLEADFVVTIKAKNGAFCLYVEAFIKRNGRSYLKHTPNITEGKRFAKLTAMDVCKEVGEYRCTGRVERVSADGKFSFPLEGE